MSADNVSSLIFSSNHPVRKQTKNSKSQLSHGFNENVKTSAFGLDEQTAFEAVTINPATLIGLADRIASIEVGKDADLAIFTGHPFSSLSRCEAVIIDGEIYNNKYLY